MLIKYCLVHFHYILDLIASNVSPQKPYRSIRFRLLGFLVQGKKKARSRKQNLFFPTRKQTVPRMERIIGFV